jgi:hypothetical protein
MARKKRETTVKVYFPVSMDLAKLKAGNSLTIEVQRGDDLLGTLSMGRGSVQWWPRGNRRNRFRKSWRRFAAILEEHMR